MVTKQYEATGNNMETHFREKSFPYRLRDAIHATVSLLHVSEVGKPFQPHPPAPRETMPETLLSFANHSKITIKKESAPGEQELGESRH